MKKKTKASIFTLLALAGGLSSPVFAQDNGIYELSSREQLSASIGLNFTVPLGQKRKGYAVDKTRLGFNIGLAREYESRYSAIPNRVHMNVLEMGYRLDGKPNLLLNGQDIYTPLFDPIYANEDESSDATAETNNTTSKSSAIVLGVVIGAAAVVGLAALAADGIEDDIRDIVSGGN